MPLPIRPLAPDEVPAYRLLRHQMLVECPTAFLEGPEELAARSDAALVARVAMPPEAVLLAAWDRATLAAVAGFRADQRAKTRHNGSIWGVYVAPTHRRQGLGRRVMEAAIDHARAHVSILKIGVVADNDAALRLYQSLGFEIWGREPMAIAWDGARFDEYHLALALEPGP